MKPSRILIEQDSDPTLLNFKRELLGLPFNEQILLNDARYMHYSRNRKHIIIKDDILCWQYYNDFGEVSHLQVLLPGQLIKVLLQSLHGKAGKKPRHFKNDARNSPQVLLPFNRNIRQKLGSWLWNMHSRQTHKKHSNQSRFIPHPRTGSGTGKSHANRPIARITAKWGLQKYQYSNRCFFKIGICLSSLQPHGIKRSESHNRHYDKTRLLTHTQYNRQRKRFRLPSFTWSSRNTGHKFETCHNKTCTNYRGPRTSPRHNQDFLGNGIRGTQETMAQIFTHCNPELQHDIPF